MSFLDIGLAESMMSTGLFIKFPTIRSIFFLARSIISKRKVFFRSLRKKVICSDANRKVILCPFK